MRKKPDIPPPICCMELALARLKWLDEYEPMRPLNIKLVEEIADTMRDVCQIQPISVCRNPKGGAIVLDGRHRCAAAGILGWPTIRAQVFPGMSGEQMLRVAIVANLVGKGLSAAERLLCTEMLAVHEPRGAVKDRSSTRLRHDDLGRADIIGLEDYHGK